MTGEDFAYLAKLLKHRSGLSLTPRKKDFLARRLQPLAERHGFATIGGLVRELRRGDECLERAVVEILTTRDTSFFRDPRTFASLRDSMLPQLMRTRQSKRSLRIWCAAAATGEEPYSVAMVLAEMPEFDNWKIEIVATDLSSDAIERARLGSYTQAKAQRGLPPRLLAKYFQQGAGVWTVTESIRGRVQFGVLNLLHSFAELSTFDVIFCRNVLMYFDAPTREDILRRLSDKLAGDGFLVLGAAETLDGLSSCFVGGRKRRSVRRWPRRVTSSQRPNDPTARDKRKGTRITPRPFA